VEGGVLPTRAQYEQSTGARVAQAVGCGDMTMAPAQIASCLRDHSAADIVKAVPGKIDVFPRIYTPNVDGALLTASPIELIAAGKHARVAVVLGGNHDETAQQATQLGALADEAAYVAAIGKVFGAEHTAAIVAHYP